MIKTSSASAGATASDEQSLSPTASSPIRVYLIDEHAVVLAGLQVFLSGHADLRFVGAAKGRVDALRGLATTQADVVVLGLDLGSNDATRVIPELLAQAPGAKVLVFIGARSTQRHQAAYAAGARGVILKAGATESFLAAIRQVHAGELWFDRGVIEWTLARREGATPTPEPAASQMADLTPREREIVALVSEGLRNKDVAQRLSISDKTVRNHLCVVFRKLGVNDRLELVVHAYRHGLVRLPR